MKVLLTVDVEAHRTVDEIRGPSSDSLGDILQLLQQASASATFFVDVCEVATWGHSFMQSVCDRIAAAGHDIQLHVHAHHYTKDHSRWLLSQYTRSEQEGIFEYAFSQFERLVGRKPTAFRAGGFGLNDDTIDIIRDRGIRIDASYMYLKAGCSIGVARVASASMYRGVAEIPMTPAIMLGTRSRPLRCTSVDFNWLPLFVIKRIMRRRRSDGAPWVVLLMHSSSMCVRVGRTRVVYRSSHFRKLQNLLDFIRKEEFQYATVSDVDVEQAVRIDPDEGGYFERNALVQYATLIFQSFKGAGISSRFALFLAANAAAGLLLLFFLCKAVLSNQ